VHRVKALKRKWNEDEKNLENVDTDFEESEETQNEIQSENQPTKKKGS